jgi:hypothetical protein
MQLSDFPLQPGNHFVAMEYHTLILNRTLLILLTEGNLIGVVANGVVSAEARPDPVSSAITSRLAIHGDLHDPLSYLREKYLAKVKGVDLLGPGLLASDKANFCAPYGEISEVTHDPSKKWGMSYYPHDGKVYVTTSRRKREFIVLGSQSGSAITEWLLQRTGSGRS